MHAYQAYVKIFTEVLPKGEMKSSIIWNELIKIIAQWYYQPIEHCVKRVCIRSFSGPDFPVFRLNTQIYRVNLHTQYECGQIRTRKTSNADTVHAVKFYVIYPILINNNLEIPQQKSSSCFLNLKSVKNFYWILIVSIKIVIKSVLKWRMFLAFKLLN